MTPHPGYNLQSEEKNEIQKSCLPATETTFLVPEILREVGHNSWYIKLMQQLHIIPEIALWFFPSSEFSSCMASWSSIHLGKVKF